MSRMLHLERRSAGHAERFDAINPHTSPERDEIGRLTELLGFSARQMADLRRRNEQLMAVNSDLRCKLGEMTLRWVDLCNRTGL